MLFLQLTVLTQNLHLQTDKHSCYHFINAVVSLLSIPHVLFLGRHHDVIGIHTNSRSCLQRQHSAKRLSNSLANSQHPPSLQHLAVLIPTSIHHLAAAETINHDPIVPRSISTASSTTSDDSPTFRQRHLDCILLDELLLHRRCLHDVHNWLNIFPHHLVTSTARHAFSTTAATLRQQQQTGRSCISILTHWLKAWHEARGTRRSRCDLISSHFLNYKRVLHLELLMCSKLEFREFLRF